MCKEKLRNSLTSVLVVLCLLLVPTVVLAQQAQPETRPPCTCDDVDLDECCEKCEECEDCEDCEDCEECEKCEKCPDPEPCPDDVPCEDCKECKDGGSSCCRIHINFLIDEVPVTTRDWPEVPKIYDDLTFPDGTVLRADMVRWTVGERASVKIYSSTSGNTASQENLVATVESSGGSCTTRVDFYYDGIFKERNYWCDVPVVQEQLLFTDNSLCTVNDVTWNLDSAPFAIISCTSNSATPQSEPVAQTECGPPECTCDDVDLDECCEKCEECEECEDCEDCEECEKCEKCPDPEPCPTPEHCEKCPECEGGGNTCCTVNTTFFIDDVPVISRNWPEVPRMHEGLIFPDGTSLKANMVSWLVGDRALTKIYSSTSNGAETEENLVAITESGDSACISRIDFYHEGNFKTAKAWCEVPRVQERLEFMDGVICYVNNVTWDLDPSPFAIVSCTDEQIQTASSSGVSPESGGSSSCFVNSLLE